MVASLSFNPFLTSNASGTFNIQSYGIWQGMSPDEPTHRYDLAGGYLSSAETLPMWGGVGITELVPGPTGLLAIGGPIRRANTLTATSTLGLTGFSVFDQNYAGVNNPQSPVPLIGSGGQVNFYRLGSGKRIIVGCDPSLIDLEGNLISQQVSWDFNNQVLQPYTGTATYALSTIVWAATNGGQLTVVASVATPVAAVGDFVTISGATNSGTGGTAVINTEFVVSAFTDNEHFVLAAPAASGVFGTIGGSPLLNYDSGALACKVLLVVPGNSPQVVYNPTTGFATWNMSGTCAEIII